MPDYTLQVFTRDQDAIGIEKEEDVPNNYWDEHTWDIEADSWDDAKKEALRMLDDGQYEWSRTDPSYLWECSESELQNAGGWWRSKIRNERINDQGEGD